MDFKLFDVEGKGYITQADLSAALKKINKQCSAEYRKNVFEAADTNGDGKVDEEEFTRMMRRDGGVAPVSSIVSAFDTLSGGTGTVDVDLLRDLMKNWGDKMTDEEIDFMIKDAEGKFMVNDGKLDYKAFAELMASKS